MKTGTRHLSEAGKCSKEHKYRLGSAFKVARPLLFKTTDGPFFRSKNADCKLFFPIFVEKIKFQNLKQTLEVKYYSLIRMRNK